MTKTWFITGCSTGFGRAIAQHLISLGHNVAVTARNPAQIADLVAEHPNTAMAIKLDVTDQARIDAAVAISESLSAEVAPLGIKVLIVEPSAFRTDWAGRSAAEATNPIADYDQTAGAVQRMIRSWSGKQAGDPKRAAEAIVRTVEAENAPLRLLLGRGALAGARAKLDALKADFDAWADVTEGADFPGIDPT